MLLSRELCTANCVSLPHYGELYFYKLFLSVTMVSGFSLSANICLLDSFIHVNTSFCRP